MGNIVEVCFNPYSCTTQILINGKPPSEYSSLIQFMTEPLYLWCNSLFDLLYSEINDYFSMIFTGRKFDADILKYLATNNDSCISFKHRTFMTDTPLQKRMILLNEVIKKGGINVSRQRIDVDFIISDEKFRRYINELEIGNKFCYIENHIFSVSEYNKQATSSKYLIILCNDFSIADKVDCNAKIGFVLKENSSKSFASFNNNLCYLGMKGNDDIFEALFECLLYAPLCDAFVNCISSLDGNRSIVYTDGFRILTAIKPLVKVDFPEEVELGRSINIKVYTEPQTGEAPEISFEYDRSGIVNCTNQRIEGIKEGMVNILLYEKGSNRAFALKQVKVKKRNRITSLLLSDTNLLLGIGDNKSLAVSYFPENADNSNTIEWLSTDTTVAIVNGNGTIHAVSVGRCQIICSAENVSVRTEIEVKPYLSDLIIENVNTDEIIEMTLDKDIELEISPSPKNAIDNGYQISSSNIMVINTFGTTIHPVSIGEAEVIVYNNTKTIRKSIKIKVVKKVHEKSSKKKGFWNLFKK